MCNCCGFCFFLVTYAEVIALVLSLAITLWGTVIAVRKWLGLKEKDRIDEYYTQIDEILTYLQENKILPVEELTSLDSELSATKPSNSSSPKTSKPMSPSASSKSSSPTPSPTSASGSNPFPSHELNPVVSEISNRPAIMRHPGSSSEAIRLTTRDIPAPVAPKYLVTSGKRGLTEF